MKLNNETYTIDGDKITINKSELEAWRDHYEKVATVAFFDDNDDRYLHCVGKHEVFADLLKLFDG